MPSEMRPEPLPYRVTIIAVGDDTEGDEGLAPRLLHALLAHHDEAPWLHKIQDTALRAEHASAVQKADLALIVEADAEASSPYTFVEIKASEHLTSDSGEQEMQVADLVQLLAEQSGDSTGPHCYSLRIHGDRFSGDSGLTLAAQNNLELATALVHSLLENPHPEFWEDQQGSQ